MFIYMNTSKVFLWGIIFIKAYIRMWDSILKMLELLHNLYHNLHQGLLGFPLLTYLLGTEVPL